MEWSIDTGFYGAEGCASSALRECLETAMAHHAVTSAEAAAAAVFRTANDDIEFRRNTSHRSAVADEAARAKALVEAKLPKLQEQMRSGIEAACVIATQMGGQVTATVSGHHIRDHVGGIFQRVAVFVDRAAPHED